MVEVEKSLGKYSSDHVFVGKNVVRNGHGISF